MADTADTQTILHPSWTGHQAPIFPDKLQVDPCFPEHTPAEMKEGAPLSLLLSGAAAGSLSLSLSQSLQLPPGSVSQCQKTRLLKATSLCP